MLDHDQSRVGACTAARDHVAQVLQHVTAGGALFDLPTRIDEHAYHRRSARRPRSHRTQTA
jgi:hypothetical protein